MFYSILAFALDQKQSECPFRLHAYLWRKRASFTRFLCVSWTWFCSIDCAYFLAMVAVLACLHCWCYIMPLRAHKLACLVGGRPKLDLPYTVTPPQRQAVVERCKAMRDRNEECCLPLGKTKFIFFLCFSHRERIQKYYYFSKWYYAEKLYYLFFYYEL